ncbi:MAG: hypothetical protein HYX53_07880 [Chloroflexi bacterium]|nr:hypothetical protein [Chloroflexota bacterium]
MVTRISYDLRDYESPEDCLRAIRERVQDGWDVCDVQVRRGGPYTIVFRRDQLPRASAVGAASAS